MSKLVDPWREGPRVAVGLPGGPETSDFKAFPTTHSTIPVVSVSSNHALLPVVEFPANSEDQAVE
jgi:hypothetical protein